METKNIGILCGESILIDSEQLAVNSSQLAVCLGRNIAQIKGHLRSSAFKSVKICVNPNRDVYFS